MFVTGVPGTFLIVFPWLRRDATAPSWLGHSLSLLLVWKVLQHLTRRINEVDKSAQGGNSVYWDNMHKFCLRSGAFWSPKDLVSCAAAFQACGFEPEGARLQARTGIRTTSHLSHLYFTCVCVNMYILNIYVYIYIYIHITYLCANVYADVCVCTYIYNMI
jgi:hypothetical protein